ncbi:MAG: hypothetical protein EBZ77_09950 [Chitinophagia bacterium]|nr:hypothetical protein [Chitinophagia bacterium]
MYAVVLACVVYGVYPFYQYYIDPDGTAYLTISARYAAGDISHAINGYWSPWSCWLTALLMRAGVHAIPASVAVNVSGGIAFLFMAFQFFDRAKLERWLQGCLGAALVVFITFATFWQSFDDIWMCAFLLAALQQFTSPRFVEQPWRWLLASVAGALAYFAKAYALPFFVIQALLGAAWAAQGNWRRSVAIAATMLGCMAVIIGPWVLLLRAHYGFFTFSTAGTLNLSWYLAGHPHYKSFPGNMLPPASPCRLSNERLIHFWDSPAILWRQLLRLAVNSYKLLVALAQMSLFFPIVLVMTALKARTARWPLRLPSSTEVITLSALVFTLGYFPINYESRYLWYVLVPGILLVVHWIQKTIRNPLLTRWVLVVFVCSLVVFPLYGLWTMKDVGRGDYQLAKWIQRQQIHSFTGLGREGAPVQRMARIAYFSGVPYYHFVGDGNIAGGMKAAGVRVLLSLQPVSNDSLRFVQCAEGVYQLQMVSESQNEVRDLIVRR